MVDGVAVVLPLAIGAAVAVLAVAAAVLRRAAVAVATVSWLLVGAVAVVTPWLPQPQGDPDGAGLRVVAANVNGANPPDVPALTREILDQQPDVAVISEPSAPLDAALADAFPHHLWAGDGTAVYATVEIAAAGRVLDGELGDEAVRVELDLGDDRGGIVLYAAHLPRPGPGNLTYQIRPGPHRDLVRRLVAEVDAETRPVVIAGDLNLTDRGWGYRHLVDDRRDAMRTDWAGPTSLKDGLRRYLLRIDHVLVPSDWCAANATRFHLTESDHRGLAVDVGPCA